MKIVVIDECQNLIDNRYLKRGEISGISHLVKNFYVLRHAGYVVILTARKRTTNMGKDIVGNNDLELFFEENKNESETVILGRTKKDILPLVDVPDHLKGKLYKRKIMANPEIVDRQEQQVVKFVYQNE